jgi:hypothetical protein
MAIAMAIEKSVLNGLTLIACIDCSVS